MARHLISIRERKSLLIVASILVAKIVLGGAQSSPLELDWLRSEVGDGALVHHAEGRLYLTELATGTSHFLALGNQPEFSPNSSKIAWIDGATARGRMRKEDPTLHLVARDVDPSGGVHWLSETEVALLLLRDGRPSWHRVSLKGSETPLPVLTSLGLGGYECDVRQSADGIWSWVANRTWRTSEGKSGTLPGTCSVSLSLDGKTATSLHDRHKEATLTAIRPGGINATLWWS